MTLTLQDISFVSRGRAILSGVSGEIPDASLTCIVGPNGAGKTTLLRILSGEIRPTSGRLLIGNADARRLCQREIAREVSIIPQDVQPPPYLTVLELVELGRVRPSQAIWRRMKKQDLVAVNTVLSQCQAASFSQRPVEELSGGEQKRAWLAFALAQEKRFLLLDETLDGLDVFAKRDFFGLLKQAASKGAGVVLTTHDLHLVNEYADRILVLVGGKVVYEGLPDVDLERCLLTAGAAT